MSILSSCKISWMFFNLHLKNATSRFSTGCSFEPIFIKFTWLVRVHHTAEPYFYFILFFFGGNNRSHRTLDMGENVPQKLVFWLSFSRYGIFRGKNFKAIFGTPFPIKKVIFIFIVQHPIP